MLGTTMNQKPRTICDPLDPSKEISVSITKLYAITTLSHEQTTKISLIWMKRLNSARFTVFMHSISSARPVTAQNATSDFNVPFWSSCNRVDSISLPVGCESSRISLYNMSKNLYITNIIHVWKSEHRLISSKALYAVCSLDIMCGKTLKTTKCQKGFVYIINTVIFPKLAIYKSRTRLVSPSGFRSNDKIRTSTEIKSGKTASISCRKRERNQKKIWWWNS